MTPQQIEQMRKAFYEECTDTMCEIRFSTMQPEQVFDWFISHIPEKEWPTYKEAKVAVGENWEKQANSYAHINQGVNPHAYDLGFSDAIKWLKDYMTK